MNTIAGALSRHPRAFTPLCAALLTLHVTAPLADQWVVAESGLTVVFLLTILLAVKSSPGLRLAATSGLIVMLGISAFARGAASASGKSAAALLIAVYAALLAGHVLAAVLREPHLSFDTIAGAVSVYLLMAHAFALGYLALELGHPGAIEGIGAAAVPGERMERWPLSSFLYFSYVTLTTLGFGDISPAAPGARVLVALEAICGQFFFAVFVARLVGSAASRR